MCRFLVESSPFDIAVEPHEGRRHVLCTHGVAAQHLNAAEAVHCAWVATTSIALPVLRGLRVERQERFEQHLIAGRRTQAQVTQARRRGVRRESEGVME